jgi:hypothetical protein
MRGSTNRSLCEATMTSPSALAAMSFIVIHRILMNKKKRRKDRFGGLNGYLKMDYNTEIDYCKI